MISYLKASVLNIQKDSLILLVNNVGFLVSVKKELCAKTKLQQEIQLYTYLAVSERALELFGFTSQDELNLFKILLKVSKIGPKTALNILNKVSMQDIYQAVQNNQPQILAKLGQKTTQRLISELKNKLIELDFKKNTKPFTTEDRQAQEALINLGYSKDQAQHALGSIKQENLSLQDKIKLGLQYLGR